jgi:SAM-dependent methyltransferase
MHKQVIQFTKSVKEKHSGYFRGTNVLEVGSLNINGSIRKLFRTRHWLGIDIIYGPGVHRVVPVHEIKDCNQFDVVVSTEMLEHDCHWKESLQAMFLLTRPGGLLLITCAGPGRPEHGTNKARPQDSPATTDYYRNLTIDDFRSVLDPADFVEYQLGQMPAHSDIQFYGIKK